MGVGRLLKRRLRAEDVKAKQDVHAKLLLRSDHWPAIKAIGGSVDSAAAPNPPLAQPEVDSRAGACRNKEAERR